MTEEAIKKIEVLIEADISKGSVLKPKKPKSSAGMKALGLASLSGLIGAGIDTYLSGDADIKDFIKPMAAWGAGGSIAHLLSNTNKKSED